MAPHWTPSPGKCIILLIHLASSRFVIGSDNLVSPKFIERIESSNLKRASNLVIDSNPKTCLHLVSSDKKDPRWIKLHFKEQFVFQRLNVSVAERNKNFSIFVVVELQKNRTKFSRCAPESKSQYLNQTHFSFRCPGIGLKGRKIFLRDDANDVNTFYLCEVQAFGLPTKKLQTNCPLPPAIRNGVPDLQGGRLSFRCNDGYILWGKRHIYCVAGSWSGRPPICRPLTCNVPYNSGNEGTIFKLPRNVTRIRLGDEASIQCREGLLLTTNSSSGLVVMEQVPAVCSQIGTWEIKTSFNCVNSSSVDPSLLWSNYATLSIIHTVSISLSLFLLLLLILLSLFLYKRSEGSMKTGEPPRPEIIISQPSQNSDRDTSTTTIYDEEIQIPDSGSLIRGPPVDDTSIIRGDFLREGQILDRGGTLFLRPKPLLTFKPHQHAVLSRVDNVPTNYCVAWTQSHLAAFEPSDENASVAERSSISCLRERDSHHIYANVNDNQPRYASLIPKPPRGLQEAIYANDVPSQSRIDEFDYSKFQSL